MIWINEMLISSGNSPGLIASGVRIMKNYKRKDCEGFSLIELIVVVAIMAVLVGVLAPAYLRYVEKARRQTCYWNMDNVVREVQLLAFSDPDFMDELVVEANSSANYEVIDFIRNNTIVNIPVCPSHGDYVIKFNPSTGELTMTCTMVVHNLPAEGEVTE